MPLIQSFPPVDGQTVQAEVLPTAGAAQLDKIYQYVGTTTPQYVNGYYYKCIYNNPNYEWVNVLVQPEANPDPSVILTGIILANGWNNNAQTVTVNDFDPSAPGTIGLLNTVTGEQYAAAANAGLRVTAIANNSVTFSCEEVPEIDIPFGVLIPGTTVNGGDGTTDYTYLDNKPQIANVTLQGNKSLADLGIAGASDVETALGTKVDKVAGKGLSTNDYTNEDKAIVGGVTSALAGKQDIISDLATIRSGASAGASAVQPSATEGLLKNDGTVDTVAKASQAAVNAILDGTNIDSFGDVETALANKVDKVEGKGLSTNDYDNVEKGKVADNASAIEATQDMISDAYDSTHTYNVGDYCIYNNVLYKCNTASTTGTWDSSKWVATTTTGEIKANASDIASNTTNIAEKITSVINNVNLFYVDGTKTYTCINFGIFGITRATHYIISYCGQNGISLMIPIGFIGNGGFGNITGIYIPPEASVDMGWLTSGNTLKIPNSNHGNWGTVSVINLIPADDVGYSVTYEN